MVSESTTLNSAPSPAWIGWRRSTCSDWQAVATGATESEAFARLLDVADLDHCGSFDNIVLPQGTRP